MIGTSVSHYRVLAKLGEGGMGVVYKARDTRLKRLVALKVVAAARVGRGTTRVRFEREAQTASALDHPNVCTIYDIGELEDGSMFIVMALYEGESLSQRIARGSMPVEEAVGIARQVATGLEAVHAKNIVHRDIKPGNIILTSEGVAKVVDFGLAKFTESRLTSHGEALGTYFYMSPEQTRGDDVDHRTDIWSLGAVLYEMLTGRPPFRGGHGQAVIHSILRGKYKPVSAVAPEVAPEVGEIVDRCLQRDPNRRFARSSELRAALARLHDTIAAPTARFRPTHVGSHPTRRPPSIPEPWQASVAVLPFSNLSAEPDQDYFCVGMTGQLITSLAAIPALKVTGRTSIMAYRDTTKDAREIGRELGVAHILTGSIRKTAADPRIRVNADLISTDTGFAVWSKSYDRELENIFDVQDDLAESIAGSLEIAITPQVALAIRAPRVRNLDAYDAAMKAMYFANRFFFSFQERDYASAVQFGQEAIELDHEYSFSYVALSYVHGLRFFLQADPAILEACESNAMKAYELNPRDSATVMAVGGVHQLKGDHDAAFRYFTRSISLNPNNSVVIHLMARTVSYGLGLLDEATRYYDRAIELDPLFAFPYHNRGYALMCLGRLDEARADLERALSLQPHDHQALGFLCELSILIGELAEAEELKARREALMLTEAVPLKALLMAARGQAAALEVDPNPKVAALLGDADRALAGLAALIGKTGQPGYEELSRSPVWASLRGDSRFDEILAKQEKRHGELMRLYAAPSSS